MNAGGRLLTEGNAARVDILEALKAAARAADSNDRVVIYLSGHGYILPRMNSIASNRAGEIFLFLDTCQMASSASPESSLELSSLDNGLFTYSLLRRIEKSALPAGGRLTQTLIATEDEDALLAQT